MNELSFALPPDGHARDWTSHVHRLRQNGHPMMLAVNRGHIPDGKSLRQLAQLRVVEEYRRFRGYAVLDQRASVPGGRHCDTARQASGARSALARPRRSSLPM